MIAHIGNIPVEESLPFLVPVVAVYLYVRRRERRRRAAVRKLPDAGAPLDAATVEFVLARWTERNRKDLSAAYLPLLYPPGPDGMTASELAERIHANPATVKRHLEELEDLGYIELEEQDDLHEPRASLTFDGYDLLYETEAALLAQLANHQ